ncbi:hypothetical protein BDK88_2694 [Natrinema hispanicum]|nr:hypothetical protein BDK88_2694 [Natrinema hispanicum]
MRTSPDERDMAVDLSDFEHPAWRTAAGMGIGYVLILAVLTVAMFVVPWLVFSALV